MNYIIESYWFRNNIHVSVIHEGKVVFDYKVESKDFVDNLVDELCDLVKHFDGEPVIVNNL